MTIQDIKDRLEQEHPTEYGFSDVGADITIQQLKDRILKEQPNPYGDADEGNVITIQEIKNRVAEEHPHQYGDDMLIEWVNDVDHEVALFLHQYGDDADGKHDALTDTVILNEIDLYVQYVISRICLANEEYDRYNAHSTMFNSRMEEWKTRTTMYRRIDDLIITWVNDIDREIYMYRASYEGGEPGGYQEHTALTDTVILKDMDLYVQYLLMNLCLSTRDFDKAKVHTEFYNVKREAWENRYKWFRNDKALISWINDVERDIAMTLRTYEGIIAEVSEKHDELSDEVMLEELDLYVQYLISRIFQANGDNDQYKIHSQQYKTLLSDWKKRYIRAHRPLSNGAFRL